VLSHLLLTRLLLPLAAALGGMILISMTLVWRATVLQQEDLAGGLAARASDQLHSAGQVLTAAGGIALGEDLTEAGDHLRLVRESYHQFDALIRLNPDGTVLLAEPASAADDLSDLAAGPAYDIGDGMLLAEPFLSASSGRPTVYLSTYTPDGGSIIGVLSLSRLQEIVEPGQAAGPFPTRIVTSAGRVLAPAPWTPADETVLIRTGLGFDWSVPGWITLTTASLIERTGWRVVVVTPVINSLRGVAFGGLAAMLLVLSLASGLVLNYARQLRRSVATPLAMLNLRASQMAKGNFTDDVSFSIVSTTFYEVADLVGNFQRMQFAVRQRQNALQASEKRFRAMAEMLPDMILELDPNRRIAFANQAVERLTGYTGEDFAAGMDITQIILAEDASALAAALVDLAEGKDIALLTLRFLDRAQRPFPVEVSLSAIRSEDGQLGGTRCVARDIRERIKSEENLRRAFRLFTAGPVVVFRVSLNETRQVEYVSPNVAQFGYDAERFMRLPEFFESIIHPNDLPRVRKEADAQISIGASYYAQEYRLRAAGGEYRWVYAFTSITRGEDARPRHLDWYIMEITERRKNEERIQVQLERLASLQTIGVFIENNADLHFTLQTIIVQLLEMLHVDGAAILRYDPSADQLSYLVHDGFHIPDPAKYRFQSGESYPGMVALSRKPVPLTTSAEVLASEFKFPEMAREHFTAYYGLPLMVKGELKGVLEVFNRADWSGDSEWFDFLETLAGQAAIAIANADLLESLQQSRANLEQAYDDTIFALARAIDAHDQQTEEHSRRLHDLTGRLAERAGLGEREIYYARIGALLHDIGKIGISTELIRKTGVLTELDREILNSHTLLSEKILGGVEYLRPALDIPRYHHEKFDGSGYPYHLKGEEIPLAARIFAIADVWDALVNARPYRTGKDAIWSNERAINYLISQKGKYFDPRLVDLFLELVPGGKEAIPPAPGGLPANGGNDRKAGAESAFTAPFSIDDWNQ
jgi:PAS domain S-box-containing protein